MTDQADEGHGQHPPRHAPQLGDGRAPVITVAVLAAATIAVMTGFVILQSVGIQTAQSDDVVRHVTTTTIPTTPPSTTSLPPSTTTTTTTTTPPPTASKSDAIVVVANASGVDGSATAMIADLTADGYAMAPVANSTGPRLEQSIIYYLELDPAAVAVARLLAEQIPTAQTLPMPDPPPLDRPLHAASVALMLGRDAAGRTLPDLQTD